MTSDVGVRHRDAALESADTSAHSRWRPYPAYKDSGVEWLGKIPEHWNLKRLRSTVAGCQNGVWGEESDGVNDVPCVRVADFDRVAFRVDMVEPTLRSIEQQVVQTRGLHTGDLLLEKSGGGENQPVGAVVLYDHEALAVCSNFIARMTVADGFVPRFLTYLHAALYAARINTRSIKQSTGIQNLDSASYLSEAAAFPQIDEQRVIAAFLDRETAKIDALVAKKERLIELLQEKRAALITRAVTKGLPAAAAAQAGLDPNVPMRDSGIEWLGEIPAHWEAAALKRRAKRIQTGSTPPTGERQYYENGVVPWYGPGSFTEDLPLQEPVKFISDSAVRDGVARVFEARSAVIVTIGATIGKVAFMEHVGSCNQQITGVTFNMRQVFPRYGAYQLKRLEPVLRGIAPNTTLPIIDQEQVGYLPFVVPPATEQEAIAAFLDRETARIDALVAKVRDAIDRLKELRAALISAAVTGKIDVRGEV